MTSPEDRKRDDLEQRAKALFDESVDALDGSTLSKLNQGRQAALQELASSSPARQWSRWAPVTGAVAAAVVVTVVLQTTGGVDTPDAQSVTDFEILLGSDDLEMLENLEFYSWLDAADLDAVTSGG